jgi:hypothetical protein
MCAFSGEHQESKASYNSVSFSFPLLNFHLFVLVVITRFLVYPGPSWFVPVVLIYLLKVTSPFSLRIVLVWTISYVVSPVTSAMGFGLVSRPRLSGDMIGNGAGWGSRFSTASMQREVDSNFTVRDRSTPHASKYGPTGCIN